MSEPNGPFCERLVRGFRAARRLFALALALPALGAADPTPHSRWSWTPLGSNIGARGFSAIDVDGDDRAELFAAPEQDYWYELQRNGLFRQTWTSFLDEDRLVTLDAVGSPSGARLAVLFQHRLEILDAGSKSTLLTIVTPTSSGTDVALGDLDLDGVLDAVTCDIDTLYRFELATGSLTGVRHGFGCSEVAVGQIDSDPQLEIVIAGNPTGGYVLDGVSLVVEWGDLEGFGDRISLGDLDADGRDEILASSDFENVDRALDPETNTELWRLVGGYYPSDFLVADLDPAPGAEAVVKQYYSEITILAGATGEILRVHPSESSYVSAFTAADTDADGDLELLWGSDSCCYNSSLWLLEGGANVVSKVAEDTRILVGGFTVGAFGVGPAKEVALATPADGSYSASNQIVILDMSQGREVRRSVFGVESSIRGISALTGVQLDGDPRLEICAGPDTDYGHLACFEGSDFEETWSGGVFDSVLDLQVAEIDGDSSPELLAGTYGPAIEAREGESGWLKWRTPDVDTNSNRVAQVLALDVDGDDLDEVLGRFMYYSYLGGDLALFSGASGEILAGPWDVGALAITQPALAPNPPHKIYAALSDSTLRGLDPLTGATTLPLANLGSVARELAVVDLDLDGTLDFVIVNDDSHIQVVNGATGMIAWTGPYLGPESYSYENFLLEAGDLDGNSLPDFAVWSSYGLFYFEGPFIELFADRFETGDLALWSSTEP